MRATTNWSGDEDQFVVALIGDLRPDQRVTAMPGQAARVIGPAFTWIAPDGANLDHTVAHLQVGRAFQAQLGQDGLGNQHTLRVPHLADCHFHDLLFLILCKHNGSTACSKESPANCARVRLSNLAAASRRLRVGRRLRLEKYRMAALLGRDAGTRPARAKSCRKAEYDQQQPQHLADAVGPLL